MSDRYLIEYSKRVDDFRAPLLNAAGLHHVACVSTLVLIAVSHFAELAWEYRGALIAIAALNLCLAALEATRPRVATLPPRSDHRRDGSLRRNL